MRSLCRLPVAKNHNFGKILTFWGLLYRAPFTDKGKFGALEQTDGLHLQAKFHMNAFIVSISGGQKPQFGQILTFLGAPVSTPFYR